MQALVFHGPGELSVQDRPDPQPGAEDSLLAVVATGICGSDLHGYTGENDRRHAGQIMGHETVARVLQDRTGQHATGTLVTVNPLLVCGSCAACAGGRSQRCPRLRAIGIHPGLDGALAEQLVAPTRNLVPLPNVARAHVGALVEPLAVGYHALLRAEPDPDDSIYVIGGGPIGQAVALAARRVGNSAVAVAELDRTRRRLLADLGLPALDPKHQVDDDLVATLGRPPSVVVDAVGTSRTLQHALDVSTVGGRIVVVGMGATHVEHAAYPISTGERTILGSFAYTDAEFRDTAAWVGAHGAELDRLVQARVPLAEGAATFRALADRVLPASKVLIHPNGAPT